jgi:hypothetical protein
VSEAEKAKNTAGGQGSAQALAFDAFITYRRSDGTGAARRLRQKLQRYDIRKRLKGFRRRRLKVFLDTVYERGAHDFYERNILPALLASRRLIVLATPDAVLRPGPDDWIQREIGDFRERRGAENILVVRAAGDFLAELPGDLSATAPNIQIIDLRHDGFWSALSPLRSSRLADEWIKLAAPLFDVPAEDMPRLRREEERAQQRTLSMVAGALAGAGAFAVTLSWYALTQQRAAEQTLENSLFAVGRVIETANGLVVPDGNPGAKRTMLMTACDLFDNLADEAAREKFEFEVLHCEMDRVAAMLDGTEPDRARMMFDRLAADVRAKYAAAPSDLRAGAMGDMLDLAIRVLQKTVTETGGPQVVKAVADNTREMGEVFRAYPTAGRIAENYSRRVWALVDALETGKDFRGSADLMKTAAGLFDALRAVPVPLGDTRVAEARRLGFQEATALHRRLAWMRAAHLDDLPGALEASGRALSIAKTGLAETKGGSGAYINLRWEEVLAEETQADALALSEKFAEALEGYKRALAGVDEVLGLDIKAEFRPEAEERRAVLRGQIADVSSVLAEDP